MKRRLQRITRELDRMGIDAGTRRNSIIGVTGEPRGVRVVGGSNG